MYLNYVCIACTFGAAICRITINKSDVGRQCCIYIHQRAEANFPTIIIRTFKHWVTDMFTGTQILHIWQ